MRAAAQLSIMEMPTTCSRLLQNSPVMSFDRPIGAKASTAMRVPPSIAHWEPSAVSDAASSTAMPRSTPTSIPSETTMALSTSDPRAMIKAARETI